ncbi:MAG: LytR/AlgR family response regulator transcription factor [Oceanicaulis sp.]
MARAARSAASGADLGSAAAWASVIFGVALLAAVAEILPQLQAGGPADITALLHHGVSAIAIFAFVPVLAALRQWRRRARPRRLTLAGAHVAAFLGFAFAHMSWTVMVIASLNAGLGAQYDVEAADWPYHLAREAVVYLLLAALSEAWPTDREGPALRLELTDGGRRRWVPASAIEAVEADRNYVVIHAHGAAYTQRATLDGVFQILKPAGFVKINRSTLAPIDAIEALVPDGPRDVTAVLPGGRRYRVSRARARDLRARLGAL